MKSVLTMGCLLAAGSVLFACGGGSTPPLVNPNPDNGEGIRVGDVTEAADSNSHREVTDAKELAGDVPQQGEVSGATVLSFADTPDSLGKDTTGATVFNLDLSWNSVGHLRVKATAGGNPVVGQLVTYQVVQVPDPGYAALSSNNAEAGEDGVADVTVDADKQVTGQFQVKAYIADDDTVDPLYFNIAVGIKVGYIPLMVGFADYSGAYPTLDQGDVLLFKQDGTAKYMCASMAYNALPTPATLDGGTQLLSAMTKFMTLPNLQTDVHQTYTVVGRATHHGGPVQAWACDDVQGRVEWGAATTVVTLTLKDIPPSVIGSYEMTSDFDLVSGLPSTMQTVVYAVVGFLQSPSAELVLLVCKASSGNSSLSGFCGNLFSNPASPDISQLTATGTIVFQIIDGILEGLLANNCPYQNDPTLCSKVWYTAQDISDVLTKFQLLSTFTFTKDPDANGLVTGQEDWDAMRLRWTLGLNCQPNDQNCGWQEIHFGDVSGMQGTITGNFTGHVAPAWTMSIDPHPLDIKYGALVDYAIEKFLLPKLLGDGSDGLPAVDSFETAIESLLAGRACLADDSCCSVFAAQVAAQTSSVLENVVQGACNALITVGASWLRSQLVALDTTPDNFTIGTKVPCAIIDTQNDMVIDNFGGAFSTPQVPPPPCQWDSTLSFGGTNYSPNGIFWGTRK